jgi:predicted membrane-bound mannosyltransferase
MEYVALMKRGQDAERSALLSWTAGTLTAAVTMSWAIAAKNSALMIPVVFAIAIGFYGMLRGRQQVRSIAGYIEEFWEGQSGPRWFTRVHRMQHQAAYHSVGDWLTVSLANAGMVLALILSWMYAPGVPRGDLMAGIVTAGAVLFGFHSISETMRMGQADWPAMWRHVNADLKDASRTGRAA